MRSVLKLVICLLALRSVVGQALTAQEVPGAATDSAVGDTLAPPEADSAAALDSLAAEIARELGADTTAAAPTPLTEPVPAGYPPGPVVVAGGGQSLNPDISTLGDFLVDLSPDESTLEEGDRFQMREVELGFQAAVDPYFRGDFFIAVKGEEIELEEGYLTTLSLPARFQARAGRFHLPFGKVNLTHRPEIRTIEYPLVIQEFFGDDGFATAGLWVSKIVAPFGFYQELTAVVGNDLGHGISGHDEVQENGLEEGEDDGGDGTGHQHVALPAGEEGGDSQGDGDEEPADADTRKDLLEDLGDRLFLGHLKNYVDLTEAANLEVGASVATGTADPGEVDPERLTFYGLNAIYRWRPPAAGLYKSLVLETESVWRHTAGDTDFGTFLFGQYQVGRRWYLGARFDHVDGRVGEVDGDEDGGGQNAVSAYLTLFPSEFSLFRLGYEHRWVDSADDLDRVLLQAGVTLGPHRPHPF